MRKFGGMRPVDYDERGHPRRLVVDDLPENVEVLPPAEASKAPTVTVQTRGTFDDRAKAFSRKTNQLSAVLGVGVAVLVWGFAGVPLLSVPALAALVITYMAVWLAAFAWDSLASAEGVQLFNSWHLWRYLGREQRERFRRYREDDR